MSNSDPSPTLLIIGGTKAGKTHFGGQLLRRLESKVGRLRLIGAPEDLTVFREVLDRLSRGKAAPHTPSGTYKESVWSVATESGSAQSTLVWPDYAGEQIERIVQDRHVPEPWVERACRAAGWLFFVRLKIISTPRDVFERPRDLAHMQADADLEPPATSTPPSAAASTVPPLAALSTQERLVELLQALLYAGQIDSNTPVKRPALTVVLSCYDEVAAPVEGQWKDPAAVLRQRLPLLSQFIEANWHPEKLEVVGLSALGKPLREDESDEDFVDSGPENQGWCITEDGQQTRDLTYPIASLMERVRAS